MSDLAVVTMDPRFRGGSWVQTEAFVAGGHLDDDTVARWAYAIRLAVGTMPLAIYRRGAERPRSRVTGTAVLPSGAGDAQRTLLDLLESDHVATTPSASAAAAGARVQLRSASRSSR